MPKQSRHQSVISRQSDEFSSEDHWLKQFEDKLQKTSVQPRGKSIYEEITSIMNSKSKYPSVQAAVDDMMQRSGLNTYLETVKESDNKMLSTKTAQLIDSNLPRVIKEVPGVQRTLENIVTESKGNLPISAIIQRLHSLHTKDTADESVWDDDNFVRYVSQKNLEAKRHNPGIFENYDSLGKIDHTNLSSDVDDSDADAFKILTPARI
jgi:hypothetical protein